MSESDGLRSLLIRADAGAGIGTGHVMRCIALGEEWLSRGGRVTLVADELAPSLGQLVRRVGLLLARSHGCPGDEMDAATTAALALASGAEWVVVDGYHFGTRFQATVRQAGLRVLVVDDLGLPCVGDVVLNQNLHASLADYRECVNGCRPLVGPRFALIRQEFRRRHESPRRVAVLANKVLVTLGGSDPTSRTAVVIRALRALDWPELEARVVLGPAHTPRAAEGIAEAVGTDTRIALVTQADMPGLMAWADLAIYAAGATSWEMAYMGVPGITIVSADNQLRIGEALQRAGVAVNVGWVMDEDASRVAGAVEQLRRSVSGRSEMSQRGMALIDGKGAARVVAILREAA